MAKRNAQVAVRLADSDLKILRRAGDTLWAGAPLSNSTLILTLALRAAKEILDAKRTKN